MIRRTILAAALALVASQAFAQVSIPVDASGRISRATLEAALSSVAASAKDASSITTGIIAVDRLPAIPAAKITGLSAASVAGLGSYVLADSTGVTDASAAINALTMAGKTAILPCGTYLLAATIRMANGSTLDGQGCATLTASPSMTANPIWGAIPGASAGARMMIANMDASGNGDITVKGLIINGDAKPAPGHLAAFYKSSNVKFSNNRCVATTGVVALDCVAFVQSSDSIASGNYCSGMTNACVDQWDGSQNFVIENNVVEGGGIITYGILINGLSTAHTTNHTWRGVVRGNIVRGTKEAAIWAGGLCGGAPQQCGTVNEVAIEGNIIDGGGYQTGGVYSAIIGIYVSDGVRNRVSGNIVRNFGGPAIRVASQSVGATDATLVADNQIVGAALNPTTSAIRVEPGSGSVTNTTLTDNSVGSGGHNYAIFVASGVTGTKLTCGKMVAGTAGMVANSGASGVVSCYDGAAVNIASPGTLKLGAGDTAGLWTLDGSGNLYPASSGVRSLGFTTNAIGLVTTKQMLLVKQTIATLPTCNSAAGGYSMAVGDGQTPAAAGYGVAVGSTTGTTTRRVLCDGAAWVYN